MKKGYLFPLFLLTMLVAIGFSSPNSAHAETRYDCDSIGIRCKSVVSYSGDKVSFSDSIYVPSGGTISFGGRTYDDSVFQVAIKVYSSNYSVIDSVGVAGRGGEDWDEVEVAIGGYYRVGIVSGDSSQGRSHARAYLQYYY